MSITAQTLKKLAEFDTPTICNVIELFDVLPRNRGFMDGRIRAAFPELPPMVGFAATASFRSDAPPIGGDVYSALERQLEQFTTLAGPAVVVFQDLDDPSVSATFGEVMCSVYKAFGSTGLITSGTGRDLLQVRAIDYPIFTSGTICSHGYCHILHVVFRWKSPPAWQTPATNSSPPKRSSSTTLAPPHPQPPPASPPPERNSPASYLS
jgi:4-hydroxy-4-methyl-2-oxoglutarate aldolase